MTTASIPTVPESPETIAIQIQQLKDGTRDVVMFPKGTPVPGKARDIGMRDISTGGNRFWHNPAKIKASEIAAAVKKNELPKILGSGGYGAPDKSELAGPVTAVVAKAEDGTPAQDIATDQPHLKGAIEAAERVKPKGGTVTVESTRKVVMDRLRKQPDVNTARRDAMREITRLANTGDIHGALRAASEHTTAGRITDKHAEKALDLAGPNAITAAFGLIPELHHAIRIFRGAGPEHQALLGPILKQRLDEMDSKPKEEQERVMALLHQHGLIPKETIQ